MRSTNPKPNDEKKITGRLGKQVDQLERVVAAAKRDALRLFRELDAGARKARRIAEVLPEGGPEWPQKVSRIMDILEECSRTIDGLGALGLLRSPECCACEFDMEAVFGVEQATSAVS